jgi:radical SAM/Cys-rich protein
MSSTSLKHRGNSLADPLAQLAILERPAETSVAAFDDTLATHGLPLLIAADIHTLQVNVGKLCNQVCRHCHVDAGPDRREVMARETFEDCLAAVKAAAIRTVDITGGAPEMNPHFEWFVRELRGLGVHVIDRCNLTILTAPGFTHLPEFLAGQRVEIVASLPCYLEENCDRQRGSGVYQKSIDAILRLNTLGYGQPASGLQLSLVYNPVGPSLPPNQQKLEAAYREQLRSRFGIEFTRLYTITNMPISRFLEDLLQSGQYDDYMHKLLSAFNPQAVEGVMCRTMLSVDWRGFLYDCDFNQMLEMSVTPSCPRHVRDYTREALQGRRIITGRHCYGCTAGAGSSCTGALA